MEGLSREELQKQFKEFSKNSLSKPNKKQKIQRSIKMQITQEVVVPQDLRLSLYRVKKDL